MRVLLIISFLSLTVSVLRAQEDILGLTKDEIMTANMSNDSHVFYKSTQPVGSDGSGEMLTFLRRSDTTISFEYIFNAQKQCIVYVYIAPVNNLINCLASLNNKYTKVSDTKWVSANNVIEVEMGYIDDKKYFFIEFDKI